MKDKARDWQREDRLSKLKQNNEIRKMEIKSLSNIEHPIGPAKHDK